MDQVPIHHQADLNGVGGEGQEVWEGADCKGVACHSQPTGLWLGGTTVSHSPLLLQKTPCLPSLWLLLFVPPRAWHPHSKDSLPLLTKLLPHTGALLHFCGHFVCYAALQPDLLEAHLPKACNFAPIVLTAA